VAPTLTLPTSDGRSLDVWLAGPDTGDDRQGHLSLVVEQFPHILDELIAGA